MAPTAIAMGCVLLTALCSPAFAAKRVTVHVLGLFHPNELVVDAETNHPLTARIEGQEVTIGDSLCSRAFLSRNENQVSFRCGEFRLSAPRIGISSRAGDAPFTISVPGKLTREYRGKLQVMAKGELIAVVEMDLETAVESVVSSELPADTPIEALKAQAIVTRSFLYAGRPRHIEADFCDTTHCTFLRSPPPVDSRAAHAVAATKGLLLTWQGKPFAAMYSASCGGRTRSLAGSSSRQAGYPYYSVACAYCLRHPNQAGSSGHGIGLSQRGAAAMAGEGTSYRAILGHYFPNTEVRSLRDYGQADRSSALGKN